MKPDHAYRFCATILFGGLLLALGCGGSSSRSTTSPTPAATSNSFDWGMPFFYGRNVFTSIAGSSATNAPYWAFAQNSTPVSGSNVAPVSVNGGPFASTIGIYPNGAFASVTVCVPGTAACQSIGGILVDTGSYGLRLLSSSAGGALTLTLPQQTASDGNPVVECTQFVDGYIWGPVQTADLEIAGESAQSVPVQVVGDPSFAVVPSGCTSTGGTNESNQSGLGANGILGVGPFSQDCGAACAAGSGSTPQQGTYYDCSSIHGCSAMFESLSAQVQNPVSLFPSDNNGVILEFPSVTGAAASANGFLVFGIGTQSNNAIGAAPVLTINTSGNYVGDFTTQYNGSSLPASFIDSGSNALFFDNASIAECNDLGKHFYCPATPLANQSATQVGANGSNAVVGFTVDNGDVLFSNSSDAAFNGLAGPASTKQ
jgi:hypothetical protein